MVEQEYVVFVAGRHSRMLLTFSFLLSSQEYQSKRPIGGPGLFVSCVRGKESRCVGEVMDMLEMVRAFFASSPIFLSLWPPISAGPEC